MPDATTLRQHAQDILVRLIASGETEEAERLIHPDYVNYEGAAERMHGPRGAVATSEWLRACFGDLTFEIHDTLVDDDRVAVVATMRAIHNGGLPPGVPATKTPIAGRHVHLFRFADDGRALEHSAVRDDLSIAIQIGLVPRVAG